VVEAVLFDWGHTLMDWRFDDEFVVAGHRAGLEALGLDEPPALEPLTAHFREQYLPLLHGPGTIEEVEYPGLVRELFGHFGVEISDEELARFLEAEHAEWEAAYHVGAMTHALLEALRGRGLKLGLVSNAIDPGWLLHRDLERQGLAERLDFAVFSSEVGKRKPHPAIFERALAALGVEPQRTIFVGDRLYEDIRGAAQLGMRTVQALWFRADEHPDGGEPDFQAFTPMDVLNVVRRLDGGP
jgi:putative hydrolase of the HAD superfamily